jgi:arylsulfatase A-like enzyme
MSRAARMRAGTVGLTVVALTLALAAAFGAACSDHGPRPNVLLIVVDTVRADRLSSYGYQRPTSTHMDRLARSGIRFANVSSTSSWTLPAHASLFTGVMPIRHGATQEHRELGSEFSTLAGLLSDAGYATVAVSGNPLVSVTTGLDRGFASFQATRQARPRDSVAAHPNIVELRDFWRRRSSGQPFFAFVNFIEAHGPYDPPEPWRSRFLANRRKARVASSLNRGGAGAYYSAAVPGDAAAFEVLSDLYDGEVAYVDALVGELMAELERAGLADDTLVIVTSDHGENLGDHGHFRHVFSLYASTVRIPLIVRLPGGGRAGEVIGQSVSLVELFPTILAATGVDAPHDQAAGRNLLEDAGLEPEPVFAEYYYPLQALGSLPDHRDAKAGVLLEGFRRRLRSVEFNGHRLVWSSSGASEIYNVEGDPGELENLAEAPEHTGRRRQLEQVLADYVVAAGDITPLPEDSGVGEGIDHAFGELDQASQRRLRELGYLR